MARRSTATEVEPDLAEQQTPTPDVIERPRGKGNYSDGKPIELEVDSEDRPYLEAITDEQRELLEKHGQLPE